MKEYLLFIEVNMKCIEHTKYDLPKKGIKKITCKIQTCDAFDQKLV